VLQVDAKPELFLQIFPRIPANKFPRTESLDEKVDLMGSASRFVPSLLSAIEIVVKQEVLIFGLDSLFGIFLEKLYHHIDSWTAKTKNQKSTIYCSIKVLDIKVRAEASRPKTNILPTTSSTKDTRHPLLNFSLETENLVQMEKPKALELLEPEIHQGNRNPSVDRIQQCIPRT